MTDDQHDLIDRDPQNLPLPVGGFNVVRKRRRASPVRKWLRGNIPTALMGVAVLFCVMGAYFALTQPPTPVYLEGGNVYVGGNVLKAQSAAGSPATFVGNGAMTLVEHGDGTASAGGSTFIRGAVVDGACKITVGYFELDDHCSFTIAGVPLSSSDVYDLSAAGDHNWHRQYSDGKSTLISVPVDGAVVPVPFPVGR